MVRLIQTAFYLQLESTNTNMDDIEVWPYAEALSTIPSFFKTHQNLARRVT